MATIGLLWGTGGIYTSGNGDILEICPEPQHGWK